MAEAATERVKDPGTLGRTEPLLIIEVGRAKALRRDVVEGLNLGLASFADRHGRQEIEAKLLDDVSGALLTRCTIEAARPHNAPSLIRVVATIDPAATSTADETEIIVAGKDGQEQGLVLADASGRYQPTEWARTAIAAYRVHHADRVVAEVKHGGEMVEAACA